MLNASNIEVNRSVRLLSSFNWLFQTRPDTFKTAMIVRVGASSEIGLFATSFDQGQYGKTE